MRKCIFSSAAVILFVLLTNSFSHAIDSRRYYFGAGASYALESFNKSVDFDDSLGFNLKSGTYYNDMLSAEINFDYFTGFEGKESVNVGNVPVDVKYDLEVASIILDVKLFPPLEMSAFKPYIFGGLGWMITDINTNQNSVSSGSDIKDSSDFCGDFGIGLDFLLTDTYSFGAKISYVVGFGDLNDLEYLNFTLGVNYFIN